MDDYKKALQLLVKKITASEFIDQVGSISVIGSVNDKEYINTWSDLDVLLMIKSDHAGNIKTSILKSLDKVHRQVSEKYPEIEISFLPHTEHDLVGYVSYSYLRTYQFATTLFPKSGEKRLHDKIELILKERNIKPETIRRIHIYDLRHLRFNLIRKLISTNSYKVKARLLIDELVRSTILILGIFDVYEQSKEKRIDLLKRYLDNKVTIRMLGKMVEYRKRWQKLSNKEYKKIFNEGLKTLKLLEYEINTKYPEQVPDELKLVVGQK